MIDVHHITRDSRANGPGRRNVLHVQGCSIRCPGCFNPGTWERTQVVSRLSVGDTVGALLAGVRDGVTISGGEPLEQPEILELLRELKRVRPELSLWLYTGFSVREVAEKRLLAPLNSVLDVLIAGPYEAAENHAGAGGSGSANQTILAFTGRGFSERKNFSGGLVEVVIGPDGTSVLTGFPTNKLAAEFRRNG